MKSIVKFIFFIVIIFTYSCSSDSEEINEPDVTPPPAVPGSVSVILTTSDERSLLSEIPIKLPFEAANGDLNITINENQINQTIEGFGAALTGSSAYLLNNNPEALEMLFGESGISLSYLRLTVGSSDFNKIGSYTYNDISGAEDLTLSQFSLDDDRLPDNPVIPVMSSILSINDEIDIMASPWSPPAWMKTNRSLNGGSLNPIYYDVYSDYLLKYLEGYREAGITIDKITVQNEPLFQTNSYPTMRMNVEEQIDFIGNHFGPKLASSDLITEIVGYDHNFRVDDDPDYPVTLLSDAQASRYVNAIAYHAYGGVPSDINQVTRAFPDVDIYFTEQSGIQNAGTTFETEMRFFMRNVFMGTLRRGSKAILLWNLALDQNGGPQNGGCSVCRGVLTVTNGTTNFKNVDYYMLGHFSKYVDPGAQVLSTNEFQGILENVAFRNPDGSKVLVVFNSSNTPSPQNISVTIGENSFNYSIPRGALVTFKWN